MENKYLTMDINIVYSCLNMKLRDQYSSLSELCEDEEIQKEDLIKRMEKYNFYFCEENNQFYKK